MINEKLIYYICDKYTIQEVLDCLSKEYPDSYKHFYKVNILLKNKYKGFKK